MKIETHTDTLSPWADVIRILGNASRMVVKVDGKEHRGPVTFELTDDRTVVIELADEPKPEPKKAKRVFG